MPLPISSKHFKPLRSYGVHKNWPRYCSGEIIRKRTEQKLSFLHETLLLYLIYIPTIYNQIISNSIGVMACTRFLIRGSNYITKKVRVVSLACGMPTGLPLHPYHILSHYLKRYGNNELHKVSASGEITS